MAIDSAISSIGLLKVSPGHEDKPKHGGHEKDGKKKHSTDESPGSHPVLNQQGQTMGKLIDIIA